MCTLAPFRQLPQAQATQGGRTLRPQVRAHRSAAAGVFSERPGSGARGKPSGAWADHPWLPAASGRGQLCTRRKGVGPVSSLAKVQKKLLFDTLIPLFHAYGENLCWILMSKEDTRHKPNEWLLWDRQTPMISMYHKAVLMSTCAMNLDSFILSLVGARPLHARKLGAREAQWRTPTPCTSAEAAHARERSHTGWKVRGGHLTSRAL